MCAKCGHPSLLGTYILVLYARYLQDLLLRMNLDKPMCDTMTLDYEIKYREHSRFDWHNDWVGLCDHLEK